MMAILFRRRSTVCLPENPAGSHRDAKLSTVHAQVSPWSGRLAGLAVARAEEKIAMGHIFIQGAGLSERQIDAVSLRGESTPAVPSISIGARIFAGLAATFGRRQSPEKDADD
jgi:hypothetical protein